MFICLLDIELDLYIKHAVIDKLFCHLNCRCYESYYISFVQNIFYDWQFFLNTCISQNLGVLSSTVLPPIDVASSSLSNDSITLSWSSIPSAVKYTLTIYKFGSNTHMKHNTSSTNLTIPGLDSGSLYAVTGHAWDLEGREGETSLYINQTTRKISHVFPEFKDDNTGRGDLCRH